MVQLDKSALENYYRHEEEKAIILANLTIYFLFVLTKGRSGEQFSTENSKGVFNILVRLFITIVMNGEKSLL